MLIKLKKISTTFIFLFFAWLLFLTPAFAVCDPIPKCDNAVFGDPDYNSSDCINYRLGFCSKNLTNTNSQLIKRDPNDFAFIVFTTLLVVAFIIVVARIALAGISMANAKEDAEKRKESFKKILNAVLGLIISFSSYGISVLALNTIGVDEPTQTIDCASIQADPNSPQSLKDACAIF